MSETSTSDTGSTEAETPEPDPKRTLTITVDGRPHEAEPGQLVIDACEDAGTCDPKTGMCAFPKKADGTTCSDGNPCTAADVCMGGTCVGGAPLVCLQPPNECFVAACSPASGGCLSTQRRDGSGCNGCPGNPQGPCPGVCMSGVCRFLRGD